ncbi:MAG: nucleoside monophosphate kinase [Candidatus Paceibacterota bacterium]|jgi:adenylate kinase
MLNIFKKEEAKESSPVACIFIGRSGCGKGTQVNLYMENLSKINNEKILHIETGSLLRNLVKESSYTAEKTKEIIETGALMPESIVIGLWVGYLINNFTGKENLVFDGAPRRLHEAEILNDTLKFYNIPKYKVVYINVSREWATARLLARGRKDDTKEGIDKRMSWFDKDVMPCIEFFKSNNSSCELININGEQSIEEVSAEVLSKVFGK